MNLKNEGISIQFFIKLSSLQEMDDFIGSNKLTFLYITQPNCSVCHGLEPQLVPIFAKYPEIKTRRIDASEIPGVASKFQVFTAPVALLFVNGKEYVRMARFIPITVLDY